jgi:hypothetical protein
MRKLKNVTSFFGIFKFIWINIFQDPLILKGLAEYEPVDKPNPRYEYYLSYIVLFFSLIAKIVTLWIDWNGLFVIALSLIILLAIISFILLLIPPRLSYIRCFNLFQCLFAFLLLVGYHL